MSDLFVATTAQILAFTTPDGRQMARNWGQTRYQSGSGATQYGSGVSHLARDIYLPPGSPVYLPFDMEFHHENESNEDGSDSMGYVYVFIDEQNRWWRFHIAKRGKALFIPGMTVPAGTRIGTTSLRNLGDSDSHLHLDVGEGKACTKGGSQCIDPIGALGVQGWNTMVTGYDTIDGAARRRMKFILFGAACVGVGTFVYLRKSDRRRLS